MRRKERAMKERYRVKTSGHFTSMSLAKVVKSYKWYIMDMMAAIKPIISIRDFYRIQVQTGELKKSSPFEKYLNKLSQKETPDDI